MCIWVEHFTKEMTFVLTSYVQEKEKVYSRLRNHYVQRHGGSREPDTFVVRTLDVY